MQENHQPQVVTVWDGGPGWKAKTFDPDGPGKNDPGANFWTPGGNGDQPRKWRALRELDSGRGMGPEGVMSDYRVLQIVQLPALP